MKKETTRRIAIILSILMLSVMLFSALYVTSEANHDCSGENCPVCIHIEQCESMLRNVGEGTAALGLLVLLMVVLCEDARLFFCALPISTPITSKVRMNH